MEHTFEAYRRQAPAGKARRLLLTALVAGTLGPLAVSGGVAAFGATSSSEAAFASGTVYLTSDGGAMFSLAGARPGSVAVSYTRVTYRGSLPADVRLYGRMSGTGLARLLMVTVTRGTGRGATFVPDPADYVGGGSGVVFRGALADFPAGWADGVPDPGTWSTDETHTYRFRVRMADDPAVQGLTAGASFRWEARNA